MLDKTHRLTRYFLVIEDKTDGSIKTTDLGTDETVARAKFTNRVERYIQAGYIAAQWPNSPVYEMTERRTGHVFVIALYDKPDEGESGGELYAPVDEDWRGMDYDSSSGKLSFWS